ncbi:hypothetical protein FNV43_RR17131 [Rhamnella rubrinervis]|uniref:Pentatricopeptide repeat-containing protein n=1 Tax=Rhamnella rubrinervis TaxID=2594499 RepID=A0A8K0E209_9ROSA|nr:hypothetical protein FNV43_RR17131 [Rhamnella rubrinervis]
MRELRQLHAQIIFHCLTNENLTLGKLISFCAVADAGDLRYAQLIFDQVIEPNKFMYNSLIRGYSNSDDPVKSLLLYRKMIGLGLCPNEFTLPFVLKACAGKSAYWDAMVVHGQSIKLGFGFQVCVQNALINVYVVCGLFQYARKVFDAISERTLVSWNSMIGGYSRMGCCKEAFLLFQQMRELQLEPDKFTLVNLLSVCSHGCYLDLGRYLHLYIEVSGIEIDHIVRNALLDMYVKCGNLQYAQTIFDRMSDKNVVSWTSICSAYAKFGLVEIAQEFFYTMPVKNVVSWNTMISCYAQGGRFKEALDLFHKMCISGVVPDEATLIPDKNVVSWNVITGALALHGFGLDAIGIFENMRADGIWPDKFTFTGLLCACSHSGLIDMGRCYFDRMTSIYNISPEIEHFSCMIDLLGRGGLLEEAIRLIGAMPMKPDVVIWGALLGACRIHGNVEIGKLILKQLLELEPHSSGLYVLLSNIFCEAQRWEDVKKIRKLMKDGGIMKSRAISFIEIDGCVCEFIVEDKRHELSSCIYTMLDQLTDYSKSIGRLTDLSNAFLDTAEM